MYSDNIKSNKKDITKEMTKAKLQGECNVLNARQTSLNNQKYVIT